MWNYRLRLYCHSGGQPVYVSNLSNDLIIEYNSVFLGIRRFSELGNMLIIMPFKSRA